MSRYASRRGFTIRLKRLKPRAPEFGDPKNLEVRTISSISVSNYICIFVLVQRIGVGATKFWGMLRIVAQISPNFTKKVFI